jgi:hypothetical protein
MDSCLCLVLDEAFWSGDKSAEGQLKGVTTAPTILIERKNKEPYEVDNLVRLIILGNDDWLVPASTDERRYGVFDVGDGRIQDRKYFTKMRKLLDEEGGNQVLLHYLKTFDLSKVDVNNAPKTSGLLAQKIESLSPFERWWFGCLQEGRIAGIEFAQDWQEQVDKSQFREAFLRFCRQGNIKSRLPDEISIGVALKKVCPAAYSTKRRDGDSTLYVYRLGTLASIRAAFENYMGQKINWEDSREEQSA